MHKNKFGPINVILIAALILFSSCGKKDNTGLQEIKESKKESPEVSKDNIPDGLKKLLKAYPEFLKKADSNHLYWNDGTAMIYDDGKKKSYDEKLNSPDLEDMMSQKYQKGKNWDSPPEINFDPGRIRYEPLFKKMYGETESAVQKNLVSINWIPGIANAKVEVNKANNLDEKFKAVSEELAKVSKDLIKYINKTAGTFMYRKIAGTSRLSAHSFGIAIDINTEYSDYWQWSKDMKYKNQIPIEIVEIFEKHGFIWGGKWYHYDTMHFEYRPELLIE